MENQLFARVGSDKGMVCQLKEGGLSVEVGGILLREQRGAAAASPQPPAQPPPSARPQQVALGPPPRWRRAEASPRLG